MAMIISLGIIYLMFVFVCNCIIQFLKGIILRFKIFKVSRIKNLDGYGCGFE